MEFLVSQLIRNARAYLTYEQILKQAKLLANKLIKQDCQQSRLKSSVRNFFGRCNGLVNKYNIQLGSMLSDSFILIVRTL